MQRLQGRAACGGIAAGRIRIYSKSESKIEKKHINNAEDEKKRFDTARIAAMKQLDSLYEQAVKELGETKAQVFKAHKAIIEDMDYIKAVEHIISTELVNAEYAVTCAGNDFSEMFEAMDNEYMRARSVDIRDISNRIIDILQQNQEKTAGFTLKEPAIIVSHELTPSETVQLDKSKILAFVTAKGSIHSHAAIFARNMNIPALVGVDALLGILKHNENLDMDLEMDSNANSSIGFDIHSNIDGKYAIVDGYNGCLYIEPEQAFIEKYKKMQSDYIARKKLLLELKGQPNVTLDGKRIMLYANIGEMEDVMNALENDADGIGLFRSEFLYLESNDYPSEEKQFHVYKRVAQNMAGRRVIIRTLDIGSDKRADYFKLEHEDNPALGYRAIRICLDRVDIFKTQLRAIYRASAYGNISIMFPMIIDIEEVHKIKKIISEVKNELDEMSIQYGEVELGVMVETPAAVMISDLLAKEVDFLSIGTNDLTQYTLAIDRQNARLSERYASPHEAILRMIKIVVDHGHREGCFVGICGELAADTKLTEIFLRMGLDELSVSPAYILDIKNEIRKINLSK